MAKQNPTTSAVETTPYRVLSLVQHDGKYYRAGSKIELTAKQAKPLIEHKAVEPQDAE
jgi:hypothetical protein